MMGFNAGINISLGDMELALDYLQDKEICEDELVEIKNKKVSAVDKALEPTPMVKSEAIETNKNKADSIVVGFNNSGELENDEDDEELEDDYSEEDSEDFEDDEEDEEDLDFRDSDEDEDSDEEEDDLDFGDEDEELDFGDEDEESDEESDEDLDEDDIDFGDEEDDIEELEKTQEKEINQPTKSDREIELENRLLQLEELAKKKEEQEKRESIQRAENERAEKEKADSKRRELDLEKRLAEAEKLLKERGNNEVNQKINQNKHSNISSVSNNLYSNSNTKSNDTAQQRQRLVREQQLQKKVEQRIANNSSIDYSKLEIEALWVEVKKFMIAQGVQSKLVSKNIVEEKFGASNIKKLYLKGYLIPFGSKLTIGK